MFESLFGDQVGRLQLALDRSTQRHSLLVANLANINTPNYKRKDMDFTVAFDEARQNQERRHGQSLLASRSSRYADQNSSIRVDKNNVDLEREVFAIAESEMRYQVLTEFAASYFTGMKNVIREGR